MPIRARFALAMICSLIGALACRTGQRTSQGPAPAHGPTPYRFTIPAWASDTSHHPNFPSDNPTTLEGVALGRRLFYETALSRDGRTSCASCHQQAHAFSDPRRFSIGTDEVAGHRNAMALMNLAWSNFYFWDARAYSLEEQASAPVTDHRELFNAWPEVIQRLMERPRYAAQFQAAFGTLSVDSSHVVRALAQFERTLTSFDSPFDRFQYGCDSTALTTAEQRGLELFIGEAHCADCHEPPLFQDHTVVNIGLDSVPVDKGMGERTGLSQHMGRFKTPSVRNCAVTAPYMHDGRFSTLEEVVDFYAEDVHLDIPNFDDHMFAWKLNAVHLDAEERKDLVAFLRALTDTSFLNDPSHGEPGVAGR